MSSKHESNYNEKTLEGIEEKIAKIDGANVSGGDIHSGLNNAINHVFFASEAGEFKTARNEVFAEVREIVKTLLPQYHQAIASALLTALEEEQRKHNCPPDDGNDYDHGAYTAIDQAKEIVIDLLTPTV